MRTRNLRPQNFRKTVVRLFSYFRFNLGLFIGGIFFILVGAVARIAANSLLSPIIDSLVSEGVSSQFIKYLIAMIVVVILISLGEYLGNLSMAQLAQRTIHRIRAEMFSHVEKLPLSFFDQHSHGELMSTFTNDVDMLNQSLEQSVSQTLISIVTVVGTFTMMLIISPLLTLIVIFMLAIMLMATRYVGRSHHATSVPSRHS